jgi:SAM-dependent methyltransferase
MRVLLRRGRRALGRRWRAWRFPGSATYWEERYRRGQTSGAGSYGRLAHFKAEILNQFVAEHNLQSVVDFGCGDGHQLSLANYPRYLGLDVSDAALDLCRRLFSGDERKAFGRIDEYAGERAELALSLDVVYHLVEDAVFEDYMERLFGAAERYVVVYSSNDDGGDRSPAPHVRHRRFTDWVQARQPAWRLLAHVPNRYPYVAGDEQSSFADFFIFGRVDGERG